MIIAIRLVVLLSYLPPIVFLNYLLAIVFLGYLSIDLIGYLLGFTTSFRGSRLLRVDRPLLALFLFFIVRALVAIAYFFSLSSKRLLVVVIVNIIEYLRNLYILPLAVSSFRDTGSISSNYRLAETKDYYKFYYLLSPLPLALFSLLLLP